MPYTRASRPVADRGMRRAAALWCTVVLALVAGLVSAVPASAAGNRVDLRALVVDDGTVWVKGISDQFDLEGVPYTRVSLTDPARPVISAGFLAAGTEAYFNAVVLPDDLGGGLPAAELAALAAFEAQFGVRQVDAYNWANPTVGLNYAANPGYIGDLTGMTGTVTATAQGSGFGYLSGTLPIGVGSYGFLATPADPAVMPAGGTFTPFVTLPIPSSTAQGSLVGVYANAGVEKLVITAAMSTSLSHFRLLAHGIVGWVTRGVHFGLNRNYLTFHFDDAFSYDARWDVVNHCTPTEDCPASVTSTTPNIRMTAADVAQVVAWQQANGYKITLPFNAYSSQFDVNDVAWNGTDGLTNALVANKAAFYWLNHGYRHIFQGCTQDFTVVPWVCTTTDGLPTAANGSNISWVAQPSIATEISSNITQGNALGLPFDASEYLSGEHSGLFRLPQQPVDNPNFAAALTAASIKYLGADASREPGARVVGGATTVPRHPVAVYYNASTKAEEVNEYNWFYVSRANGGSGYCDDNPATATCLPAPLSAVTGFDSYIVPTDAANDLRFVLSNDPRPFYAHVSNLTGPDYLGLGLLTEILAQYRTSFAASAPTVNLSLAQASDILTKQQAWAGASTGSTPTASGYLQDGVVTVTNSGAAAAPVTVPIGTTVNGAAFGSLYGGERSGWVDGNAVLSLPGATFTSAATTTFTAGVAGTFAVTTSSTDGVPVLAATGTLPTGVTFTDNGNGTATLAGTPATGQSGPYPLTFSATTSRRVVTQAFVLAVNAPPAFTSAATVTTTAGTVLNFVITTTGYPAPVLTRTGGLPTGITFTANANGTATLAGTTSSTGGGSYPLTFTARNAAGTVTQAFTLLVVRAPVITSTATGTATVGTAFSKAITTGGYPIPTVTVSGLPAGLTFTANTTGGGTIAGVPAPNTGGIYPVTVTATSSLGTATQALALTVRQAAAITSPANLTVRLGQPFSFTVTTTGYPTARTSWDAGLLPFGVRWVNNPNGTATISGTPRSLGRYVVLVNAFNSVSSVFQNLNITVSLF